MDQTPEAPAEDQGNGLWTFANVQFDERSLELRVAGQPVEMERKSLEVLRQLLYRAGEVATKDELLEAVWPGRILSETVLAKCISRIRQVLGDDDQQIVKTVHGYGYRLIADVKVQVARSTLPPPKLALNAGDSPPLRPEWKLVKRLGAGGQGEVWLCKHEKLGSQRVLKFALEESGLAAIKREITLHRLLRDTLGERADLCNVIDWNLKEPPFFIELEYAEGGNLEEWAAAQGGLTAIPLAARLDIVVHIADVLAATHSVGVLHKDLKPTNVLMGTLNGAPQPRLTDFGSGGLMDPLRLEALGITRMGFTKSVFAGNAEATPLYRAPELMTGQPATVQADIFSLGVMLYQVVVGDLRRPLAPGWENDVEDPLLREDIALAVAGDRGHRLTDVATVAQRLRSLEQRRDERQRQLEEQARLATEKAATEARARQAELTVARLTARRNWVITTLSVLIVGMALSVGLWVDARRARNEARESAATSQAVADFLARDMFSAVGNRPLRNLTVRDLLVAASGSLAKRELTPDVAAQIHGALGGAFWTMELIDESADQLQQALDLEQRSDAAISPNTLMIAARLLTAKAQGGVEPLEPYEAIAARGASALGSTHDSVLTLRYTIAHVRMVQGNLRRAAIDLEELLSVAQSAHPRQEALIADASDVLAFTHIRLGEPAQAETIYRQAIQQSGPVTDDTGSYVADLRCHLGLALAYQGKFAEADHEVAAAEELMRPWTTDESSSELASVWGVEAHVRQLEHRHAEAIALYRKTISAVSSHAWNQKQDVTYELRSQLSESLNAMGRRTEALQEGRRALKLSELDLGTANPVSQGIRITLALMLAEGPDRAEAATLAQQLDERALADLPENHPTRQTLSRLRAALGERQTAS